MPKAWPWGYVAIRWVVVNLIVTGRSFIRINRCRENPIQGLHIVWSAQVCRPILVELETSQYWLSQGGHKFTGWHGISEGWAFRLLPPKSCWDSDCICRQLQLQVSGYLCKRYASMALTYSKWYWWNFMYSIHPHRTSALLFAGFHGGGHSPPPPLEAGCSPLRIATNHTYNTCTCKSLNGESVQYGSFAHI